MVSFSMSGGLLELLYAYENGHVLSRTFDSVYKVHLKVFQTHLFLLLSRQTTDLS